MKKKRTIRLSETQENALLRALADSLGHFECHRGTAEVLKSHGFAVRPGQNDPSGGMYITAAGREWLNERERERSIHPVAATYDRLLTRAEKLRTRLESNEVLMTNLGLVIKDLTELRAAACPFEPSPLTPDP